jgi:TfoX/Sxy family transcriptional regulator of competence genes
MAYDEALAARLREHLEGETSLTEKKMFGGLAFLVGGNMAVAASSEGGLMLRCDPDQTDHLTQNPHAERFDMHGRSMAGWLRIDAAGVEDDDDLARWADIGVGYARTLPAK